MVSDLLSKVSAMGSALGGQAEAGKQEERLAAEALRTKEVALRSMNQGLRDLEQNLSQNAPTGISGDMAGSLVRTQP